MMQLTHQMVAQPKLGALRPQVWLCWMVPEPAGLHQKNVRANICHCLPPDRTRHQVDYWGGLGGGKVGHESKLEPCWTIMQLAHPKVAQLYLEAWWPQAYLCWTVPKPAGLHKENVCADLCYCFPPDRTWHNVNDPKVDYNGSLGEGTSWSSSSAGLWCSLPTRNLYLSLPPTR